MKKMLTLAFFLLLCFQVYAFDVEEAVKHAPPQDEANDSRILYRGFSYEMPSERKVRTAVDLAVRVYTQNGREKYGDISLFLNENVSQLVLKKGGTYDPSGAFVSLEEKGINTVTAPNYGRSLMYGSFVNRVFSFACVDNKSTVYLSYQMDTDQEEGYLSSLLPLKLFDPIEKQQITIAIPQSESLKWKIGGSGKLDVTQRDGKKLYRLSLNRSDKIKLEENLPSMEKIGDFFMFSSAKDWNEAVDFLRPGFSNALGEDESVTAKSREILAGRAGDEARLKALIAFVCHNIDDVYLPFGTGGYKPRSAGDILKSGYGDPKDKYILFAALSKAAGFDVLPALVRSNFSPIVMDVPTVKQFDAIVPAVRRPDGSYGLVDVSSRDRQIGFVDTRYGAQALLLEESAVRLIPREAYFDIPNTTESLIEGVLTSDGNFEGKASIRLQGFFDEAARGNILHLRGVMKQRFFDQIGEAFCEGTEIISFETSDPEDYYASTFLSFQAESPGYAVSQDNFLIFKPSSLPFRYGSINYSLNSSDKRVAPYSLGANKSFHLKLKLQIPHGYVPVYMPKSFVEKKDYGIFTKSCSFKDQILTYESSIQILKDEILPGEYESLKSIFEKFRTDEYRLILLRKKQS